jgi:hypothetical protein
VKSTGLSGVNPEAAEIATNPEKSDYTSIKQSEERPTSYSPEIGASPGDRGPCGRRSLGQGEIPAAGPARVGVVAGGAPREAERHVRFRAFRILDILSESVIGSGFHACLGFELKGYRKWGVHGSGFAQVR